MAEKNSGALFNKIAPLYNLFYSFQKRHFRRIIENAKHELDLTEYGSVLDVGCGTGRHSIELSKRGYLITGIDLSESQQIKPEKKQKA